MIFNTLANKYLSIKSLLIILGVTLLIFFSGYLFGVFSYLRNIPPLGFFKAFKQIIYSTPTAIPTAEFTPPPPTPIETATPQVTNKFDEFGRLIFTPDKVEIDCPVQGVDTAVIVAFGQSNSANYGQSKVVSRYPESVVNYFGGKCYKAASPLLGATGVGGEFLIPLADTLLQNNAYKTVIIFSAGVGGSSIMQWQKDGDLNKLLLKNLIQLKYTYSPTQFVWHQGETDFANQTSEKIYRASFNSLHKSIQKAGFSSPFFISISTKCGNKISWTPNNPISNAQHSLINERNVFLGANTDLLINDADRATDHCHFSEEGLIKTGWAYADSIMRANR